MKELTVIELSEQTGLTRSQIYHLNKKHNLINSNEKINYEYALPIITALTIKKAKKANEKNFRQILNMLILQNTALQKQLDLTNEREKTYLSELTSCQQSLAQKTTLIPSIDQGNAQSAFENDKNEKVQNPMPSESQMHSPKAPIYGNNMEAKSASENGIRPLPTAPIQNQQILSESGNSNGESSRKKNDAIGQKENVYSSTPSPTQNNTQQPLALKIQKKEAIILPIHIPKNIPVTIKRKPNLNQQSEQASGQELMTDQKNLNGKVQHD